MFYVRMFEYSSRSIDTFLKTRKIVSKFKNSFFKKKVGKVSNGF